MRNRRGSIARTCTADWDAARALGLRPWRVLRFVILPQALNPCCALRNQSDTVKNTSLVVHHCVPDIV